MAPKDVSERALPSKAESVIRLHWRGRMKQSGVYLLFACIGFVGGCGSAASADYELPTVKASPLLTLYSQMTSTDLGVMTNGMRAAFVWFPASPGAAVQVSQDLGPPLKTDGIPMAINVTRAPPAFAETASRQAELVFYLDGNGNDKLDVYPLGIASPDRVVGRAPDTRIVWGLGRTDTTKAEPTQRSAGRVCTKEPPDYSLVCGMDDNNPGPGLAVSSPIPVQFLREEVLGSYTCAGFWGSQEWLDGDLRLSTDLRRQICNRCSSSNESASGGEGGCRWEPMSGGGWKACVDDPRLCGTTFCHVATGPYVPGQSDCP